MALETIAGKVDFDDVTFGYKPGNAGAQARRLTAEPGQTIALVGPTGAGKTTIINLLSRFYDVDAGAIRIDDIDIRRLRKSDLRRQLGVVLQDTYLFADTVMDNIRYGRLDATDEEVIAAARLANADHFIRAPAPWLRHPALRARRQPEPGTAPVAGHRPRRAGRSPHPRP